jgi:DNA-binding IclR family transcriptional regulator
VLFLSCVQTRSGFLSNMNVGTRMPAYATPMGWLLLSDMAGREIAALYEEILLTPLTEQTPRDVAALTHRIGEAIANGYVVSRGIMEAGGSSVSAPVFDKTGRVVAAIDISGPDSAFQPDRFESFYVPEVVAAAARISARRGYTRR